MNLDKSCNICYILFMDLNIRNFPEDLHKQLKIKAAKLDITLREVVIELIQLGWIVSFPSIEAIKKELKK